MKSGGITETAFYATERVSAKMEDMLINTKPLQYIMGHSDISVTLNTYTHLNFDDAKVEFDRVMEA